jgi:hypothetical protein
MNIFEVHFSTVAEQIIFLLEMHMIILSHFAEEF